jgi:hypothetical protein
MVRPPVNPRRRHHNSLVGNFDNDAFVDFTSRGDAAAGHDRKRG